MDTGGTNDVGRFSSVALTTTNVPVIAYYDLDGQTLKLARCANASCSSSTTITLDSAANVGQYASLALDASGNPRVAYYDATNGDLKIAICGTTTCQ